MSQTTGNEQNSGIKNLPAFIEAKRQAVAKALTFQRSAITKAKLQLEERKAELVRKFEEDAALAKGVEIEWEATV